jgi:hypothetical protein
VGLSYDTVWVTTYKRLFFHARIQKFVFISTHIFVYASIGGGLLAHGAPPCNRKTGLAPDGFDSTISIYVTSITKIIPWPSNVKKNQQNLDFKLL